MSFIFRYVIVEDKQVEVLKSFLGFITKYGKIAYDIKKMILNRQEKEQLEFKKCRKRGFDNAISMAEVHGGVQCLLRNINRKAKFVPCSYHSLNSSGVHASAVNATAITFFGVTERLYTFFSSSNHWKEVLSSYVKVMMKHLVTTSLESTLRSHQCSENGISWSDSGTQFINLCFRKSSNERGCTNHFAFNWKLLQVTFVLLEEFLGQINLIQKKLQEPGIGFDVCVTHMDTTKIFL